MLNSFTKIKILNTARVILFCAMFFGGGKPAHADSYQSVLDTAKKLHLAHHPTWLKLIHYPSAGKQSVVLTDNFFLAPDGRTNPDAELTATIKAYFYPAQKKGDENPRCKYPARYYWLSHQLTLPDYELRSGQCERLENWALFDSVKSVSLLLVSGYLGNPASTFGHALLKLNTDSNDDQLGLFDLTLNYGALVPKNEFALRYVISGLFGGYRAGFSDKYFYTQDMVYSRTEFRDMWDYRLNLTDYQRTLLILHIWEIVGNKFAYYFLKENCAYRLAELVELVTNEDLTHNGRFWYLPVELFYRLSAIQSIHYIPSSQRVLYHQLKRLNANMLKVFNAIIHNGINSMSVQLSALTNDQKILVLDSLLAYQEYRLIAEQPHPSRERKAAKDKILLARLQLPAQAIPLVKIPALPSPAEGSRPMEWGMSAAMQSDKKWFSLLQWSPFKNEMVGRNSLEGDELVVLDLAAGFLEKEHKAFIDSVDIIRVLHLNTLSVVQADENRLSWKIRIGSNRVEEGDKYRYDGVMSFGAGPAWRWNQILTGYAMVDIAAHTIDPYARLRPNCGIKISTGELRTWLYYGAESSNYKGQLREVWGGKVQFQVSNQSSIHIEISNEKATTVSAGLSWYW
ncbi:MAG: DUF4105 domain-containing protein [Candidatus Omnitrophica bacterium]|nr:DUF4105 domain-containing protein [Candidatus Omnitrophota bacterium]